MVPQPVLARASGGTQQRFRRRQRLHEVIAVRFGEPTPVLGRGVLGMPFRLPQATAYTTVDRSSTPPYTQVDDLY